MKVFDASGIRNVALVGHSGSGKTQLTSALAFDGGAVNRFGKVDEGTTITDYDEEAIARKHTLAAGVAAFEWNKCASRHRHAGHGQLRPMPARRCASPTRPWSGRRWWCAEVSTEKVWGHAEEFQLPRLIVINRLDRERASVDRTIESIRSVLGRSCIAVQLPIGEEKNFKGVVELVSTKVPVCRRRVGQDAPSRRCRPASRREAQAARDGLIEMVAEADDSLMEKLLDAGTLTQEELTAGLAARCDPASSFQCFARRR